MTKRERILMAFLGWSIVAAAAAVSLVLIGERSAGLQSRIAAMEEQLQAVRLQLDARSADGTDIQALEERVQELRARFYEQGRMDPYSFGVQVRDLLVQSGLSIRRYQTVDVRGSTLLEFSLQGDALSLARFLQRVASRPKQWTITFLSVRAPRDSSTVQAVLRIGYEEYDANGL
jgi:hypothetical protein